MQPHAWTPLAHPGLPQCLRCRLAVSAAHCLRCSVCPGLGQRPHDHTSLRWRSLCWCSPHLWATLVVPRPCHASLCLLCTNIHPATQVYRQATHQSGGTVWHASTPHCLFRNQPWEAHLQAPLQEIHHGREKDIRLCLADFENCKRVFPLGCQIQWQQHCAVHTTSLRIGNAEVHAFVVGLHIVAELRLHAHATELVSWHGPWWGNTSTASSRGLAGHCTTPLRSQTLDRPLPAQHACSIRRLS